ncbi:arsenate reductase family protein [Paenibacillus beijingensis]|uniref:Arsenate reductase n=1 Tax=Paenibacillus beijingensis TaxID=1126833 RepID=A0A0D5NES5_9BACL|nr:arsenate reductase family protein [Paenibacillus beijingensis]AJY73635.1 hypothetical protein VN24_02070 [Paenibacillus beijingensis]
MSETKALKVYQYAKCGTCRSAVKRLKEQGYELELVPLFDTPPDKEALRELVERSGLGLKRFYNTSGEVYKQLGLKDKLEGMSEEEQLELLASNGRLLKRPIVTDGSRVTVGYKDEVYRQEWDK